ncbi:MAG: OmpA family protein [Rickettsiales bacterium]|nr:OmpA family protein [Rickettsiales bacterium]
MRILYALSLLVLLCSCATTANLEELRRVTPSGTPYAIALTQHYLAFSEKEAKNHDWTDSSYFAEKGLMAGYGQTVTAEEITSWNIDQDLKPELAAAREKLLSMTDAKTREQFPKEAAEATFAFDCWLEELEEGWNKYAISHCQNRFDKALNDLEFAKLEIVEKERIANTAYLVYFGYNLSQFDQASKQVVTQVIADVVLSEPTEILIHGHTDSKGGENYNMNLSEKRALSVLEALIAGGIPPELLKYFAFGETDPAVDKGENAAERKNRRVEIFLG